MRMQNSITYGIEVTKNSSSTIEKIVFEKSVLGKNYPTVKLVGETISAVVEPIPTDAGRVYDWGILGNSDYQAEEEKIEIKTYYGILKKIMHYSKESVVYLMEDYNGNEYIIDFLRLNLRTLQRMI